MGIIKCENISVCYSESTRKKFFALKNVNITVNKGDIFGFIGPNGAGKTTLLNVILGLIKPAEGGIRVFDQVPEAGMKLYSKISYLPEEPIYHEYLTVYEAILSYSKLYGLNIEKQKIDDVINFLKLDEFKKRTVSKLSKGMKQKVGIAQALINKPELMLLDEPTRGLDPVSTKDLRDALYELNRQGTTIFLNSHLLSEIEMMCNRVAIIDKGSILVEDSINNICGDLQPYYQVELGPVENIPDFITVKIKTSNTIQGEIPSEKLGDLFDFIKNTGTKLFSINTKKTNLEDALSKYLKKEV